MHSDMPSTLAYGLSALTHSESKIPQISPNPLIEIQIIDKTDRYATGGKI